MRASATELNKHPGKYIDHALKEPVVVERSGRPVIVMLSFELFTRLEDAYWGELATNADQDKSIGRKASLQFLQSDE